MVVRVAGGMDDDGARGALEMRHHHRLRLRRRRAAATASLGIDAREVRGDALRRVRGAAGRGAARHRIERRGDRHE